MSLSGVAGLVLLEAGRRAAQPRRARLQHVSVAALVVDRACQHAHTQTYRNDGPAAAEARYVFPLPDGASVSAFSATFSSDGRRLEGAVRRLPEARALYHQALDGGCRAALLEEDRPDVFQASVGGVGPGEEVTVALEYCLELAVEAGAVRLTIPSHVGERYVPKRAGEVGGVLAGMPGEPTRSAHLSVEVQCSMGDEGIRQISSPSHPDVVVVPGLQGRGQATARLQAQGLDRDVVLLITPQGLFEPVVAWEEWAEQGTQALMLSLVPKFELPMRKVEAVFLLDCSASMRGSRMEQSRRSVQIFLRSLPSACRFNVVTFGSGFAAMAKRSVVYSDAALATGAEYIDGIEANMGGTNIAPALRSVIDAVSVPGFERQIFVITDGKVSNEQEVIDLARSGGHRVFALGIGSGVSTFLVNGLARASQGHAAFAQDGDKLHPICISLLRKALTPRVSNMRITWPKATVLEEEFEIVEAQAPTQAPALSFFNPGQKDPRAFSDGLGLKQLQQAPRAPPAIFADRSFCAFALYAGGALPEAGAAVTLEGDTPFGPLALQVPLPQEATRRDDAPLVHRMAARALIRDDEEMGASAPEGPEAAAELLSLRFGLLCRSTAFVAVDEAGDQRPLAPRSGRGEGEELGSVAAGDLRRGCHVMIKGRPCKVLEVSTSKTGKHGHAKAHIVAFDMETGAKIEDLCPTTHSLEVQGGSGGDGAAKAESGTRQRKRVERRDGKERKERREGASGETAWHLIPTSEQRAEEDWEEESAQRWRQGRKEQSGEELEIADPALGARCGVGSERGPEAAAARALEGLLRLAAADGSFTPSHALWAALGATAQSAGAWASETVGRAVEGRVVATALALGCLSSRFGEDEESWGLVAEKAKEWLAARRPQWLSESVASMEGLLAAAAAMHSG